MLVIIYTGSFTEITVENKGFYCYNSIFSGPPCIMQEIVTKKKICNIEKYSTYYKMEDSFDL